ncbi:MAG: ImuA protein [Bradyrhizobiaceae bacterium]|nr:ImuA protein [Bradyrhizobiaceae bacterium]
MKPSVVITPDQPRAGIVTELRRLLPRLEGIAAETRVLPFGIPEIDSHLPQGGLAFGSLHEIAPETKDDGLAAFGFVTALLGRISQKGPVPRKGPVLFITSMGGLGRNARISGHGLHQLGLDPARTILVRTGSGKQSLWALEEALRSGVPAAVAGTLDRFDLKTSQRLQFAARESGVPLLLLRPAGITESTVAMTRWRVRSMQAARDRFGLIARWRWRFTLERCRNGRTGEWLVEYDDAYRFSLAAAVADPALPHRTEAKTFRRTG